jgi:hypothetical protein
MPTTTQLKVLVTDPANDWDFPLKIFGIAVVFAGLMYMLFAHSDVVRENLVLGVNKVRRLFGQEDLVYHNNEDAPDETHHDKNEDAPDETHYDKNDDKDDDEDDEGASTAATKGSDTEYSVETVKKYVDSTMSSGNKERKEPTAYCLVGEDMGLRTCVAVTEADKCMSGDIFTSENKCVNPNLRHYDPETEEYV